MKIVIAFIAILLVATESHAQLNPQKIHNATVRISVTQPNGQESVASGFLWQNNRHVITALHAIRPKPAQILVECRRVPTVAKVIRYLREADLALLETQRPIIGCSPLSQKSISAPEFGEQIYAFGLLPIQDGTTGNILYKGTHDPETLRGFSNRKMHRVLDLLKMPDPDLQLFKVNGVIMKGLSGGPVVNKKGELVGIVEGGLEGGLISQNWVVPAENIIKLMQQPLVNDVSFNIDNMEHFFSFAIVKEAIPRDTSHGFGPHDGGNNNATGGFHSNDFSDYITARDSIDLIGSALSYIKYQDSFYRYLWLKSKIRTIDRILETSPRSQKLDELFSSIVPESVPLNLREIPFDIYIEETLGLVISVPNGVELKREGTGDDWKLIARSPNVPKTNITVEHRQYIYTDENNEQISASDDRFFEFYLEEFLENCKSANIVCELNKEHYLVLDYSDDASVFRFGFFISNPDTGEKEYRYQSIATRGDDAFIVTASLNLNRYRRFIGCLQNNSPLHCGSDFWKPGSFVLAAALTNFSSMLMDNVEPTINTYYNDCDNCDKASDTNDLSIITYASGSGYNRFMFHSKDGWFYRAGTHWNPLIEEERGDLFGTGETLIKFKVKNRNFAYFLPIEGGRYFIQKDDGELMQGHVISRGQVR